MVALSLIFFLGKDEKVDICKIDQNSIEDFDIILSKGQSAQSKIIRLLNLSTKDYSHIGIIYKEKGKVFVLHATPDGTKSNGIRYDDLETFINLSQVCDFIILRGRNLSLESRNKLWNEYVRYRNFSAPFDFDFDNLENAKIYCSELVWLIYKSAELFETRDFNIEKPIYPSYFLRVKNLDRIDRSNNLVNQLFSPIR